MPTQGMKRRGRASGSAVCQSGHETTRAGASGSAVCRLRARNDASPAPRTRRMPTQGTKRREPGGPDAPFADSGHETTRAGRDGGRSWSEHMEFARCASRRPTAEWMGSIEAWGLAPRWRPARMGSCSLPSPSPRSASARPGRGVRRRRGPGRPRVRAAEPTDAMFTSVEGEWDEVMDVVKARRRLGGRGAAGVAGAQGRHPARCHRTAEREGQAGRGSADGDGHPTGRRGRRPVNRPAQQHRCPPAIAAHRRPGRGG